MSGVHHDPNQASSSLQRLVSSESRIRESVMRNDLLFARSLDAHSIELTSVNSNPSYSPDEITFRDHIHLSTYLVQDASRTSNQNTSIQLYSIHQKNTWAPLSASRKMIALLSDHYQLTTGFFQILAHFQDRHVATEESFAGASRSTYSSNRLEFGWIYKYSEKKQVGAGNPWRIRHTGIYHVFDRAHGRTTLFVISPRPNAYFATHVKTIMQQAKHRALLLANPMLIHPMLVTSHLSLWQSYLEYHEALLLKLDMKPACSSLGQSSVTFETLKQVREVEKKIIPLDSLLTVLEGLIDDVREASRVFESPRDSDDSVLESIQATLKDSRREVTSYKLQACYLQRRAQSSAQSVLDALNLGFQKLAQEQSRKTSVMAKSAREDSVAIRAITLVTSFYLPFSFVATVFGMNLVDFNAESRNLVVSSQFWLYFVISVPLTVVTLACWRCRMQRYRKGYVKEDTEMSDDAVWTDGSVDVEKV
ncbi:hypothetical protein C7974DRAFT_194269 [Boeremia exigua]|uniref:uncharacterized protein n=1 Tax=Boeremia exigua TaxID=749465 RepID=UPI001E8EEE22|nr:uncharacterized protein C7974DRAFT_194269 [Boeremia exigua]KAH6629840.1 hypothetical protein C7974DRAFT_194269 [Boeremia exigua]